jgi:hypothetical protein
VTGWGGVGGCANSLTQADVFNPKRANLDKVLNWNGVDGDMQNAPRGCPGHDLSQKIVKFVVDFYLQGEP